MKNKYTCSIVSLCVVYLLSFQFTFGQALKAQAKEWTAANLLLNSVFVENRGQFSELEQKAIGDKILYYSRQGKIHFYFTQHSFVIRYDSIYRLAGSKKQKDPDSYRDENEEELENSRTVPVFTSINYENAYVQTRLTVSEPESNYFTYNNPTDLSGKSTVLAHAWKKLVYRNIYKGIDIEFYFPEKGGIKYTIIVHPGTDPSQIKMTYSKNSHLFLSGNDLTIFSPCGNFTDHAPLSYYEDGEPVQSSFELNGNTLSFKFSIQNLKFKIQNLIIDPWITATNLKAINKAYDVNYDLQGNVYVYGGSFPYQEAKYSNSGTLLWTYTTPFNVTWLSSKAGFYGDFTIDKRSGSSYIGEGWNTTTKGISQVTTGSQVVKLNALGKQVTIFKGDNTTKDSINEIWRMEFDYCNNQLIIGAGENWEYLLHAAKMDTNCTGFTKVNIPQKNFLQHDIALLTLDGNGNAYMGSSNTMGQSNSGNFLMQLTLNPFSPPNYQVNDQHSFEEISSVSYYPSIQNGGGNGFNGLAANQCMVLTYDGATIRKWSPSGQLLGTATPGINPFLWGGIDIDLEGNIYVGYNKGINVYDSNLKILGTIPLKNIVYDLHVGVNGQIYACGNGFVQSVNKWHSPGSDIIKTTITGCTVSATASVVTCGTPTYSWNTGQTTQTITGLTAGKYIVTVSDMSSCDPKTDTASIQVGPSGSTAQTTQKNVLCAGGHDGSASIVITGNQSDYTFSWSPVGGTGLSATGLAAGTYTCKVHSACADALAEVIITEPPAITHVAGSIPATCGKKDGSAAVTVNGGTPPYSYLWNTSATVSSLQNISTGNYTLTTTDDNGCKDITIVKVPGGGSFQDTGLIINVKCFGGNDGSASITSAGGTAPYTYLWMPGGQTTASASALTAGTYTCTINDNSGVCADTIKIMITQPTKLLVQATVQNVICHGDCNGGASVISSGATTPYAYSWSNGSITDGAKALCAGSYSITVSDKNLCSHDTVILITEPSALSFTKQLTPAICNQSNGAASVTVSGGTPAYTYSWDSGLAITTAAISGVRSGTYILTATDAKGCKDTISAIIQNIASFSLSASPSKLSCFGDSNGNLSVTVSGSTSPYTYSWNSASGGTQTNSTISGLKAGKYAVTVTDKNGCTGMITDSVTQPSRLIIQTSGQVICSGSSTTLSGNANGGISPYTYLWDNKSNGSDYTVNPTTTTVYSLNITDANGCSISKTDSVIIIPIPQAAFSGINVCLGNATQFIDSSATNGGSISQRLWNFGDGTSGDSPNHTYSMAGTYTVTLIVSNGACVSTITHVVNVYPFPKADFSANPQPASILDPVITFTDLSNGGITGSWDFGDGTKDNYTPGKDPVHTYPAENIPGGETYRVKLNIVNEYGCPDTISKLVHLDPEWTFFVPNTFTPNGDGKNDLFFGTGIGIIEKEMWIFDRWGNQIFHTNDLYGGWDGKVQGGNEINSGGLSNEIAQIDTYVWLIVIKEVFMKTHRLIGHVNIIK